MDKSYDMLQVYELMHQGKMSGYICQGFNQLAAAPYKRKMLESFSKLKFLIIMDPLVTETSKFCRNVGEYNDVDSSIYQTEVIHMTPPCFANAEGTLLNSCKSC